MVGERIILHAEGVDVRNNGKALLSDIDLAIPRTARLLIQGPSGAGKTTLFHVLGLLEPPTSGRLIINGTDAAALSERQRAQLRRDLIGIIFQDFQLVPDLTARENAALPQEHAGNRDEAWLDELFRRLDVEDIANQYPATLSGGEKQRIAIARALANQPDVVMADEPTGQLDPATADRVLKLLFGLQAATETALVVVSHDRRLADQFDETIRIEDGQLTGGSNQ